MKKNYQSIMLDYKKSADVAWDHFYREGKLDISRAVYLMDRCNVADSAYLDIVRDEKVKCVVKRSRNFIEEKTRKANGTYSE
jgi:hypothetical protein